MPFIAQVGPLLRKARLWSGGEGEAGVVRFSRLRCGVQSVSSSQKMRSAEGGRHERTRLGGRCLRSVGGFGGVGCPPSIETTSAARRVVIGTAAINPMLPARSRTISVATGSPLRTSPMGVRDCVNRIRSGSDAPAYAKASVLTADAMWSRPIRFL